MIDPFSETKQLNVLRFFLTNPEKKFRIRELSRATGVSPTWVSKIVVNLKKIGFVQETVGGLVETNMDNENVRREKQAINLVSVYASGLIDHIVHVFNHPEVIVLFGSYSKGSDLSTSDIDIAILTPKKITIDLEKFEKKIGRKININQLDPKKITDDFKNTLANGIIVYGYLKVI